MLKDLGLQTEEQIKAHNDCLSKRDRGCVSSRICENCKHLISDSICLCIGIFTCPNCNFRNGAKFEEQIDKLKNSPFTPIVPANQTLVYNDYLDLYKKCHDICAKIYIARNITLDERVIINQLKEIDKLLADKEKFN